MTLDEYIDRFNTKSAQEYRFALQSKLSEGGYRIVFPDEIIEEGDLFFYTFKKTWREVTNVGGTAAQNSTLPRIRKLKPETEPARSASETNPEWGVWQ